MSIFVPAEMREEIVAGVNYLKALTNGSYRLDPVLVEVFGERLMEILCRRYTGHWYPEKPMKGQAYRCIRINQHQKDESILEACALCGITDTDLALPREITLWIDPYEVSCQLREYSHPYTVASFDPMDNRTLPSSLESDIPTTSLDSGIGSTSPSSSFASSIGDMGEDMDSGVDSSTEELAHIYSEQATWTPGGVCQTPPSRGLYRTSSPLWIPSWRAADYMYSMKSPEQNFWM
ncbi:B-cell translocation gene 5, gene 2 S homeolog isoform X2 [Xenopus laevis]|nr:B-cell translocation gene 5, gene 2 S homeolog isoform X2 [Xenopus laevis]